MSIRRTNAEQPGYRVALANGSDELFDAVIVATTTHQAATLLGDLDPSLAGELNGIEYASSAIVVTAHKLANVRHPLNSFGLVVPHCERRRILATSFSSRKFPERAPADSVLMRTFVGGAMQPELYDLDDDELRRVVVEELSDIFGIQGDPELTLVVRYPRAMPQYHVGHLERVARIESRTATHAGLALAGNALRGVGIPDAITSGEAAASCVCGIQ
jgi:oxygen-dependent protoporphyrinogen oxidase